MLSHLSNTAQLVSGEPGNSGLFDMKAHDKLVLTLAFHEFLHELFRDSLPTHLILILSPLHSKKLFSFYHGEHTFAMIHNIFHG